MGARSVPETTPKQAAKALNVTTRTVFNYIRKGLLKSRKEGQKVFIDIDSVEKLRMKLSMERDEPLPGLPEKAPPGQERTIEGSFTFQFNPTQHVIVERREYEALLVRLGHLESEVKLVKHEPEAEKKKKTFWDWFWGREP